MQRNSVTYTSRNKLT